MHQRSNSLVASSTESPQEGPDSFVDRDERRPIWYVSTSRSILLLNRSIYRSLLTRGAFLIGFDHELRFKGRRAPEVIPHWCFIKTRPGFLVVTVAIGRRGCI
jgi:hypothetical protein